MDSDYQRLVVEGGAIETAEARGFVVGHIAISYDPNGRMTQNCRTHERGLCSSSWFLDHIPSKLMLTSVDSWRDALVVADDMMRFAKAEPSAADIATVIAQFGPAIDRWLQEQCRRMRRGLPIQSFLEWRPLDSQWEHHVHPEHASHLLRMQQAALGHLPHDAEHR